MSFTCKCVRSGVCVSSGLGEVEIEVDLHPHGATWLLLNRASLDTPCCPLSQHPGVVPLPLEFTPVLDVVLVHVVSQFVPRHVGALR